MVNGGFPPMKSISKPKKTNSKTTNNINLKIKNILSDSIVKPMIELNKKKIEVVNDL